MALMTNIALIFLEKTENRFFLNFNWTNFQYKYFQQNLFIQKLHLKKLFTIFEPSNNINPKVFIKMIPLLKIKTNF